MAKTTTHHTRLIFIAATVIAILGCITLYTMDRLALLRGRTIEQAVQARWNLTQITAVLLILALLWSVYLGRSMGVRTISTKLLLAFSAVLLIATLGFAGRAVTTHRDVTVTNMVCAAEALKTTGGDPLMDCREDAVDTIVLLQGVQSDDQWVPDAMTNNTVSKFTSLPPDTWQSRLTVDGPPDTTAVSIVGMQHDRPVKLATFKPVHNNETNRMRWSGVIKLPSEISDVRVLFYLSPNPDVASATLRFEVRACDGQSIRSFNAQQCSPLNVAAPVVMEQPMASARTWRYPLSTMEGNTQVIRNLEARTYVMQPDLPSIQMLSQSADVLIIPKAMAQTEENSITHPGQSGFEINVQDNTGTIEYIVYIFPAGPTYANAD